MTDEKTFITIREAAKLIGVTPLTLRNWDKRGFLVPVRNPYNNYRLYRHADLVDFLGKFSTGGNTPVITPSPVATAPPRVQRLSVRFEESEPNRPVSADTLDIETDKSSPEGVASEIHEA